MTNDFINNSDGTTLIFLTQGQFTLIDTEDHTLVRQYKWIISKQPKGRFGVYAHKSRWENIQLARLILKIRGKLQIHHINRNLLDNRKCNLKITNTAHNQCCAKWISNTSGHRGVSFDKRAKVWIAQANINGKRVTIMRTKLKLEAIEAYNAKMVETYREFITHT